MYVAMSRVRSLNGMYLTGIFDRKAIKADKRAFEEYERMCKECIISPPKSLGDYSEGSLTIPLLNTRSLQLHAADIASVKEITESDVVCFTETQLPEHYDTADIRSKLPFYLEFNNSENKFESIAYGIISFDYFRQNESFPGVSIVGIEEDIFSEDEICIVILYRLHSQPIGDFYYQLNNLVNSQNIHILLGDFNVDYFDAKDILDEVLSDYTMVVIEPTHIDGSLLDHIYIKKDWLQEYEVTSLVKCIFFSDHDVVKIRITPK